MHPFELEKASSGPAAVTAPEPSEAPDLRDPVDKLREMAEPVARAADCELLDVEILGSGGERIVRITLDRPEGVTVDRCVEVSRRLSPLLDIEDPIPGSYQLEVSSPGLNRPLKREQDYIRHRGQRAKIETRRPVAPDTRQKKFSGILGDLKDGRVALELEDGRHVEIPIEQVRKANLIYEFDNP